MIINEGFSVAVVTEGRTVQWVSDCCVWACCCSRGLADNCVIARVDGDLWDLDRPLEKSCSLELLRFDHEDAQAVSPAQTPAKSIRI